MSDSGDTKDDVKVPEGEVGEKIDRLFNQDQKDTSMWNAFSATTPLMITDVIVLTSMGEEVAVEAKEAPRA